MKNDLYKDFHLAVLKVFIVSELEKKEMTAYETAADPAAPPTAMAMATAFKDLEKKGFIKPKPNQPPYFDNWQWYSNIKWELKQHKLRNENSQVVSDLFQEKIGLTKDKADLFANVMEMMNE